MSDSHYTGEGNRSRPKLKVARLHTKTRTRLRLGGMEPSDDMQPGEYKVLCEGASWREFAKWIRVELKFRVIDGPHTGTGCGNGSPSIRAGYSHRGAATPPNARLH